MFSSRNRSPTTTFPTITTASHQAFKNNKITNSLIAYFEPGIIESALYILIHLALLIL